MTYPPLGQALKKKCPLQRYGEGDMTTTQEKKATQKRPRHKEDEVPQQQQREPAQEAPYNEDEAQEEFMNNTAETWASRMRQRARNGWERAKKFGSSFKDSIKNGAKSTKDGAKTAARNTWSGTKATASWILLGVTGLLFAIGHILFIVAWAICQTVAFLAVLLALVVASVAGLIAAAISYVSWFILRVIWFFTIALATPFLAYRDHQARRHNGDVNRVKPLWHSWIVGMRPRNWHHTAINSLRVAALAENPPRPEQRVAEEPDQSAPATEPTTEGEGSPPPRPKPQRGGFATA